MGSEGGSGGSGGGGGSQQQSQFLPLGRQGSFYSLTLDEVENQLGDLGKPLTSMNLDELLQNVWTAEANQVVETETEKERENNNNNIASTSNALQRQQSLTLTGSLSKKTVDEVWRDIQQQGFKKKNDVEDEEKKKAKERKPTLGEMTLEDFLVKAGVVSEDKKNQITPQNFPQQQQTQWLQFHQHQQQSQQHTQQNMMGVFMPVRPVVQPLAMVGSPLLENQMSMSPLMGTLSDTQTPGRKRLASGVFVEKTVERRQKRMIKNRESAARSRARKQAYTSELENKVSRLEEENERLKKQKELEKIMPSAPIPEPKFQLRRTSSAPY